MKKMVGQTRTIVYERIGMWKWIVYWNKLEERQRLNTDQADGHR